MNDDADILWQATVYGREALPATHSYWYENRDRPSDSCIIQVVEAGQVQVRACDGTQHLASAGHAFLFRYGEDSAYGFPDGNTLPYVTWWITLVGAGLAAHWDFIRAITGPVVPVTDEIRSGVRHLAKLAEPRTRCSRSAMAMAVHAFVIQLVTSGGERRRQTQSPVERAIDDLLANPAAPWSLKEVADAHGVSREHLTRAFMGRIGQPPATWLNQARITKACHLLGQTDIAIADITEQAGFASTHTMARLIKDATGHAPSHYREQRRKNS